MAQPRRICLIARDISKNWKPINYAALPYVRAMAELNYMSDNYGQEDARDILNRFLCNASSWRGDDARRIKAELRAMLKQ